MTEKIQILKEKRILLFSQFFFGYEEKIAKKMREMGASVYLYDEMSVKKPIERALLKVNPYIFKHLTEQYYDAILNEVGPVAFDYIVFIDCEMPTKRVLKKYKATFPHSRFCLYLWDSVNNIRGVKDKFEYFDIVSTFDRDDSNRYGLMFRPLFYCDEYTSSQTTLEYKHDLSFIGTIHSDRFYIIKKLIDNGINLYLYPYLQSRFIYYYYRITKREFKRTRIDDFVFDKIDSQSISRSVSESRAVLDIQHPKQTGLTMRTIEMLGIKKKLVTTNRDIVNYSFYDPNNIIIIDRKNPVVDKEFFSSPYEDVPADIYEYYSLYRWVSDILGVTNG